MQAGLVRGGSTTDGGETQAGWSDTVPSLTSETSQQHASTSGMLHQHTAVQHELTLIASMLPSLRIHVDLVLLQDSQVPTFVEVKTLWRKPCALSEECVRRWAETFSLSVHFTRTQSGKSSPHQFMLESVLWSVYDSAQGTCTGQECMLRWSR